MDTYDFKSKLKQFGTGMKDSAEKLTKSAMDGSKKVTEKVKVQATIRKAEARLNDTYLAIGKKYEEVYGSKHDPEFTKYMAEIADARAQIAAARAELSSLDSAMLCTKCGKYVTENQKFCPYCGTKLIRNDIIEAEVISSDEEDA